MDKAVIIPGDLVLLVNALVTGKLLIPACHGNMLLYSLDGLDAAKAIETLAAEENAVINYTIIVDSGLHRFGLLPEKVASFADALKEFSHLRFRGISTHPGHVYGASSHEELPKYCADESGAIAIAADALRSAGYTFDIISSGSTPTFWGTVEDKNIGIYHPGNYIFNDAIQLSNGTATEEECALCVLASVISHPSEDLFICDAGAKCLGLDQGAHGNAAVRGFGMVKGHPELVVYSLSEEVGKMHVEGKTDLKVGDKILIIPNHACSSANLTSKLIAFRGDTAERLIDVDIRGNNTAKNF